MTTAAPKKKLTTSAMIASFADPGQRTTSAPFGHARAVPLQPTSVLHHVPARRLNSRRACHRWPGSLTGTAMKPAGRGRRPSRRSRQPTPRNPRSIPAAAHRLLRTMCLLGRVPGCCWGRFD